MLETPDLIRDKEIEALALGPYRTGRRYKKYNMNGWTFRTVTSERGATTQNSGIIVVGEHEGGTEPLEYFGRLTDIIELNYSRTARAVLFRCDWVDVRRGVKKDWAGFTKVDFSHLIHTGSEEMHDPFVLAHQAKMVFYVDDESDGKWQTVIRFTPRTNIGTTINVQDGDVDPIDVPELEPIIMNE